MDSYEEDRANLELELAEARRQQARRLATEGFEPARSPSPEARSSPPSMLVVSPTTRTFVHGTLPYHTVMPYPQLDSGGYLRPVAREPPSPFIRPKAFPASPGAAHLSPSRRGARANSPVRSRTRRGKDNGNPTVGRSSSWSAFLSNLRPENAPPPPQPFQRLCLASRTRSTHWTAPSGGPAAVAELETVQLPASPSSSPAELGSSVFCASQHGTSFHGSSCSRSSSPLLWKAACRTRRRQR